MKGESKITLKPEEFTLLQWGHTTEDQNVFYKIRECGFKPVSALGKGHRLLLKYGLQSCALCTKNDMLHLNTIRNANFSSVMWIWGEYDNSLLAAAPGFPWARWVSSKSDMPPMAGETAYMSSLRALSLGDEMNFNNSAVRANTASWYAAVRNSFPETILFCNNWGGQIDIHELDDYIRTSDPDMLSQDTYPWFVGETWPGGSPNYLFSTLQQYRRFGIKYRKPTGLYTQTYHASSDTPMRRDPSESELYLNYFAGVTFGCTFFTNFTYNTNASSLFTPPGGDSNPTPLYAAISDINARLRKLSPALTRLTPRAKNVGPYEASIFFIRGKNTNDSTYNPAISDVIDDWGSNFSTYIIPPGNENDPWIRGWTITNTGTKNNGLKGDVFMAWFKVLDESFDGDAHTSETYVMLLNGLSDAAGTSAQCRQSIRLNYIDAPETRNLLVFNQKTGQVETTSVPLISSRRQPTFILDGGQMELFKFDTGASFVGSPTHTDDWTLY